MTTRERLHAVVDRLDDEQAGKALEYIDGLVFGGGNEAALPADGERVGQAPPTMTMHEFMTQPALDWRALAASQGVKPIRNVADLHGDFWPEDEGPDDFITALREWRREGGCG